MCMHKRKIDRSRTISGQSDGQPLLQFQSAFGKFTRHGGRVHLRGSEDGRRSRHAQISRGPWLSHIHSIDS